MQTKTSERVRCYKTGIAKGDASRLAIELKDTEVVKTSIEITEITGTELTWSSDAPVLIHQKI